MYSKNKIALIGMPLSGKSTIAKALSACMKVHYADLDDEIERKHGSIASIFAERGEKEFRKIEKCTLQGLFKNTKTTGWFCRPAAEHRCAAKQWLC